MGWAPLSRLALQYKITLERQEPIVWSLSFRVKGRARFIGPFSSITRRDGEPVKITEKTDEILCYRGNWLHRRAGRQAVDRGWTRGYGTGAHAGEGKRPGRSGRDRPAGRRHRQREHAQGDQ